MKFTHTIKTYLAVVLAVGALLLFVQSTSRYIHEIVTNKRVQLAAVGSGGNCSNWANARPSTGLYVPNRGAFYLLDSDGSQYTKEVLFGPLKANLTGLAGDWDNSGFTSIGYYDPDTATFNLKYEAKSGAPDVSFRFLGGIDTSSVVALAGKWSSQQLSTVAFYDKKTGEFYLKNANTEESPYVTLSMLENTQLKTKDASTLVPIVGDWIGDGVTRVGLYDPASSTFYLRKTNDPGNNDVDSFVFRGPPNGVPVVGRWNPDSNIDDVGLKESAGVTTRNFPAGKHIAPQGFQGSAPQLLSGTWKPSKCLQAGENTSPNSPSWAKDMIFYHVRIETFTPERTLRGAMARLPYLRDLGVTGIVLTALSTLDSAHDDARQQVFYGPSRPDVIDQRIGTDEDMRAFVAEAHRLGLKVIADNVMHGINPKSAYIPSPVDQITYTPSFVASAAALPADYFNHTASGMIKKTWWGTAEWDWTSPGLRSWWSQRVVVPWVQKYGVDGFRIDLEPVIGGTVVWSQMRTAVLAQTGKEILLMPELRQEGRGYTFELSQLGYGIKDFYDGNKNFVDFVKSNKETFETAFISNHDNTYYVVNGRLGAFGYAALLSPLIPYWMVGEEFNATRNLVPTTGYGTNLYFTQLNWAEVEQPEKKAFLEQVKKLIQIRKQYKDIIAPLNRPLNQSNIAKVTQYSGTDLEPYIMWNSTTAIAVVAKNSAETGDVSVTFPVAAVGMSRVENFKITNLMTGEEIQKTLAEVLEGLTFPVEQGGILVLKIEGQSFTAEPADILTGVLDTIPGIAPEVRGFVDGIIERRGVYKVNGWACMRGKNNPIDVHVYLNNPAGGKAFYASGKADLKSEDGVARACGASGTNYRFSIPFTESALKDFGGYGIEIHGISTLGLANWTLTNPKKVTVPVIEATSTSAPISTPASASTPTSTPSSVPNKNTAYGYFDVANCSGLHGWAVDMDTPEQSISIELKEGTESLGVYRADQDSADVNRIVRVTGAHRFSVPVPASLRDGKEHKISVYGLDSTTSSRKELMLSPRTLTCR